MWSKCTFLHINSITLFLICKLVCRNTFLFSVSISLSSSSLEILCMILFLSVKCREYREYFASLDSLGSTRLIPLRIFIDRRRESACIGKLSLSVCLHFLKTHYKNAPFHVLPETAFFLELALNHVKI